MEVPHIVAEILGDGQEVRNLRRRAFGCGFEAEVAGFGVDIPVLVELVVSIILI